MTTALNTIMMTNNGQISEAKAEKIQIKTEKRETTELLKNFQNEALTAFKQEIINAQTNTIQVDKFKEAFEFISQLGNLNDVKAEV